MSIIKRNRNKPVWYPSPGSLQNKTNSGYWALALKSVEVLKLNARWVSNKNTIASEVIDMA